MRCTDMVICACLLTERRHSTSSSILWRVPLWQMIADHGRACCGITSLQSHPRLPITHTLRHPCRLLFILLRQALTIPVSHSHPCSRPTQRFLGLVIRQHLPYLTNPATCVEGKLRSLCPACVRQRMGPFFWHPLPMPVLPAFTTITLLPHTPLIIIGGADVAFNRLCSCLVFMPPTLSRHYLHYIILLYTIIHFPARSHTNYVLHFWTRSIHPLACHFLYTIPSDSRLLYRTLYITPMGLIYSFYNGARAT